MFVSAVHYYNQLFLINISRIVIRTSTVTSYLIQAYAERGKNRGGGERDHDGVVRVQGCSLVMFCFLVFPYISSACNTS